MNIQDITKRIENTPLETGKNIDIPTYYVMNPKGWKRNHENKRTIHVEDDNAAYYIHCAYGHRKYSYKGIIKAKEGFYIIDERLHHKFKYSFKHGLKELPLKDFNICKICTIAPVEKFGEMCNECFEMIDSINHLPNKQPLLKEIDFIPFSKL